MLSIAYKWLGEETVHCLTLPDFLGYRKYKATDDKPLIEAFLKVMNQADILIGHNGDNFDFKKFQARLLKYDLDPPKPLKMIDTLKAARRVAKFPSNKLDDLGNILGIGRKLPHTGKLLWFQCMAGEEKAWRLMKRYNKQDVVLLERVYLKLRPFIPNHPNVSLLTRKTHCCPFCQSERYKETGRYSYTRTRESPIYQCSECRHYFQGKSEPLAIKIHHR